jgi:transposase
MVGTQDRCQEDLFVAGPLQELVPEDHILKQVDKILDLSWLRDEVKDAYSETMGRPSIGPEAAVRLMLAGFFQGMVQDRKLMREAQVNLAIRWFAGHRLDEALPDHSSLTRIRQRWGVERFKRIFEHSVQACMQAGLVNAETVHIDATLIRADVSWASLVEVHAQQVLDANPADEPPPEGPARDRELYIRHPWQIEGTHGRAKTQHGLRRAVRRGLDNVSIQAYLTAAAMNLKRLARRLPRKGLLWLLQANAGWPIRTKASNALQNTRRRQSLAYAA